jgi:selenocysteine lyase/cysteine desulfurase
MVGGRQAIFFDGPGGSQSPDSVGDAVRHYLLHQNANVGMSFATSVETNRLIDDALRACADFVGCENHREIVFGQNMTSLTIQLASALSRTWNPGDEVVVTRLDHDSNVHPWMLAAEWSGATLRRVDIDPDGCTHNRSSLEDSINENTVLVAVGAASNLSGTINDVSGIAEKAHAVGAEVFVDAVHYAPHCLINVEAMGCDYLTLLLVQVLRDPSRGLVGSLEKARRVTGGQTPGRHRGDPIPMDDRDSESRGDGRHHRGYRAHRLDRALRF